MYFCDCDLTMNYSLSFYSTSVKTMKAATMKECFVSLFKLLNFFPKIVFICLQLLLFMHSQNEYLQSYFFSTHLCHLDTSLQLA